MTKQHTVYRLRQCFAAITMALLLTVLLSACSEPTVWLEETPEHCYEGTAIHTLDYLSSAVFSVYKSGEDRYTYHSTDVVGSYSCYRTYLHDAGYEASVSSLERSEYKTEYGTITLSVTYNQKKNVNDNSGKIVLEISRTRPTGKQNADHAPEIPDEEKYASATEYYQAGDYLHAFELFAELGDYAQAAEWKDAAKLSLLQAAAPGDVVAFGTYEQNNSAADGAEPIYWTVLAQENGKLLVISRKCLDCKPYDESNATADWAKCSLRFWLNQEFYASAFSESEQSAIANTVVPTNVVKDWAVVEVTDRIYILSEDEVEALGPSGEGVRLYDKKQMWKAEPTEYAAAQGLLTNNGTAEWWLRPSWDRYYGGSHDVYVGADGGVCYPVTDEPQYFVGLGIRPVMWINVRAYEEICNME